MTTSADELTTRTDGDVRPTGTDSAVVTATRVDLVHAYTVQAANCTQQHTHTHTHVVFSGTSRRTENFRMWWGVKSGGQRMEKHIYALKLSIT